LNLLAFRSFLLLFFVAGFMAFPAAAQNVSEDDVPDSCDPDVLTVMNLRARLEGEREMEVAQALILRPDSVLEYSCFQPEVRRLGQFARRVFSANTENRSLFTQPPPRFNPDDLFQPRNEEVSSREGPRPQVEGSDSQGIEDFSNPSDPSDNRNRYPGREHFERNVSGFQEGERGNLVAESLFEYIERNFRHTNLGGAGPARTECDLMKVVWDFAKCANFSSDDNANGEYIDIGFETLEDFPQQYNRWSPDWAQCPLGPAPAQNWQNAIDAVNPEPNGSGGVDVNMASGEDTAYIPEMKTGICNAAAIVRTGVMVNVDGTDREEGVCLMPGCYFNNGTCQ